MNDGCSLPANLVVMSGTSQHEQLTTGTALDGTTSSIAGMIIHALVISCHDSDMLHRWHGDPATTRPVQPRSSGSGVGAMGGGDDPDVDDDTMDFNDQNLSSMSNGLNGLSHDRSVAMNFLNPQNHGPSHPPPSAVNGVIGPIAGPSNTSASSISNDQTIVNVPVTQNMLAAYLQFLQTQTQTGKMKLEYMRRREEREEKDSTQRRELERAKMEREAAEFEHTKTSASIKQKADRAIVRLSLRTLIHLLKRIFGIPGVAREPYSRGFREAGGWRLFEEVVLSGLIPAFPLRFANNYYSLILFPCLACQHCFPLSNSNCTICPILFPQCVKAACCLHIMYPVFAVIVDAQAHQ